MKSVIKWWKSNKNKDEKSDSKHKSNVKNYLMLKIAKAWKKGKDWEVIVINDKKNKEK